MENSKDLLHKLNKVEKTIIELKIEIEEEKRIKNVLTRKM